MTTARILSGIKQTLHEGHAVKIDLTEASALTGSGDGIGGRTFFDNAFAALRFANPIRELSRVIPAAGSSVQFVAKQVTPQTPPTRGFMPPVQTLVHQTPPQAFGNCQPVSLAPACPCEQR